MPAKKKAVRLTKSGKRIGRPPTDLRKLVPAPKTPKPRKWKKRVIAEGRIKVTTSATQWHFLEELQVVGGYYHMMWEAKVDHEFEEGSTLVLRPEPFNVHDANALAVYTERGTMLGYLPRERAAVYAPLLRAGVKLRLRVVSYIDSPRRLNARLYVSK